MQTRASRVGMGHQDGSGEVAKVTSYWCWVVLVWRILPKVRTSRRLIFLWETGSKLLERNMPRKKLGDSFLHSEKFVFDGIKRICLWYKKDLF